MTEHTPSPSPSWFQKVSSDWRTYACRYLRLPPGACRAVLGQRMAPWPEPEPTNPGDNVGYRRFILLSTARSGSTWLMGFLRSHPSVAMLDEVFHPGTARAAFHYDRGGVPEDPSAERAWMRSRDLDPAPILNRFVYRGYPDDIRAVGFKAFYGHMHISNSRRLRTLLTADPDLHVIHLKRTGFLQMLSSRRVAEASGKWGNHISSEQVEVTPDECRREFENWTRLHDRFDQIFHRQPRISVTYEEMVEDSVEVLKRVLRFLDLPDVELSSFMTKQERRSMRDAFRNYDALKQAFAGTRWSGQFTD